MHKLVDPQITQITPMNTNARKGPEPNERRDEQTFAIIGAAMEVHRVLGMGFPEAVYQEALAQELTIRSIPFREQVEFGVSYKHEQLKSHFRVDFLVYEDVIVEIKSLDLLSSREKHQVLSYLKASGKKRALLINFGSLSLQYERLVW